MVGSTEEEQAGSETNASELSEEKSPIETIASASEDDAAQAERTAPTPTSPATNSAAKATEQKESPEGAQAGETESSTTDEVIDLGGSPATIPAHPARSPPAGTNAAACDGEKSNGGHPCGRPLASSSNTSPIHLPAEEKTRQNRWGPSLPAVCSSPSSRSRPGQ